MATSFLSPFISFIFTSILILFTLFNFKYLIYFRLRIELEVFGMEDGSINED